VTNFTVSDDYIELLNARQRRRLWTFRGVLCIATVATLMLSGSADSQKGLGMLLMLLVAFWAPIALMALLGVGERLWRLWAGRQGQELAGYEVSENGVVFCFSGGARRTIEVGSLRGWRFIRDGKCALIALVPRHLRDDTERLRLAPADVDGFARLLETRLPRVERKSVITGVRVALLLGSFAPVVLLGRSHALDRAPLTFTNVVIVVVAVVLAMLPLAVVMLAVDPRLHGREYPIVASERRN
jgi:hypothetical protein